MSRSKNTFAYLDSDSEDEMNPAAGASAPRAATPPRPPPRRAAAGGGAAAAAAAAPLVELPQYLQPWVLFEDIDSNDRSRHPCPCCILMSALDDEVEGELRWTCARTGRSWLVLDHPYDPSEPHDSAHCFSPECPHHKLHRGEVGRWIRATSMGMTWANLLDEEQDALDALKSASQLAAERAERAAEVAAAIHKTEVAAVASQIERVQEAVQNRYAARGKTWQPCKKLYKCEGGGAAGGVARPTTLHVCTECWGWEYTDPRTGQIVRKRTCPWMHPGEEGWQPEWDTDRTSRVAAERVRALQAQQAAAGGGGGGGAVGEWRQARASGGAAAGGARPASRGDERRGGGGRGGGGGGGHRHGSGSGARGGW
jgi:hypothetical protein